MQQDALVHFAHAERLAHFLRGPAFDVAQADDRALPLREALDGIADVRERLAGEKASLGPRLRRLRPVSRPPRVRIGMEFRGV